MIADDQTNPVPAGQTLALPLILRTGVALCFIGHGCYGILTKAAWLPYFEVVGIGESTAWLLMPWVGAMDIAIGFLAFIWPCRALFVWATVWTFWTALLRPLAGQGWSELLERAGNYGVPVAILVATGLTGGWWRRLPDRWARPEAVARVRLEWTLRIATAVLLAGHAGCALLLKKGALAQHYAVFTAQNQAQVMAAVGWFELSLAGAVLLVRGPVLMVFVCVWKLATEALFLTSGVVAPFFEFIERGGSYVIPLALAVLLLQPREPEGSPSFTTVNA